MTATIDHTERIQRLAGDIADRYPDSETHAATQAIIANVGALEALDAELVAERARGKRLRRLAITAGDIIANGVTPERQQRYLYALAQCGGHHDLDEGGAS